MAEFTKAVLRPRILAGCEWVTQARTRQQALDELSTLRKTLYEKSFGALEDQINRALDRPSSKSTFIGVLDIAGFEIFEVNVYEQLLINYMNEPATVPQPPHVRARAFHRVKWEHHRYSELPGRGVYHA